MATVLITGGTGLIGAALSKALLEKGYEVIVLTRGIRNAGPNLKYAQWDIKTKTIDKDAISSADYIIHLAGAGIADKRWTKKRKREIVDSRVEGGKLITESLVTIPNKVKAVVSASGIGWYGADLIPGPSPRGGEGSSIRKFVETDPAAIGFLGETCEQWEQSIDRVGLLDKRIVWLRTGIVISKKGGVLREFLKPLRFGFAAILGNGKQLISWIHIDDLVNIYIAAIENEKMSGVFNAVSPLPVTNKEFSIQFAKSRKKFFIPLRVPSFLLKWVLGEMCIEVLKSTTVSSVKIESTGFVFNFPTIDLAMQS